MNLHVAEFARNQSYFQGIRILANSVTRDLIIRHAAAPAALTKIRRSRRKNVPEDHSAQEKDTKPTADYGPTRRSVFQ